MQIAFDGNELLDCGKAESLCRGAIGEQNPTITMHDDALERSLGQAAKAGILRRRPRIDLLSRYCAFVVPRAGGKIVHRAGIIPYTDRGWPAGDCTVRAWD